ncbi:hypothetical protein WJX77_009284 [Trebouxia sp. C0004]
MVKASKRSRPETAEAEPSEVAERDSKRSRAARRQAQPEVQQDAVEVQAPGRDRREVMADVARRRAAHFANYAAEDDDTAPMSGKEARTLGPWSSARQLVEARSAAVAARQEKLLDASRVSPGKVAVSWKPSRDVKLGSRLPSRVRPLFELCADVLVEYIEDVESLLGLPDSIKNRLSAAVCQQRKLSNEVVHLFSEGQPAEVVLTNCAALEPDAMALFLRDVATPMLERLELTFCGRGLTESAAAALAAAGPLDQLRELTLRGAYRLNDASLCKILRNMPKLQVLRLPQNSLLTEDSIRQLPSLVPLLRELDLSECRGVSGSALQAILTGALPALESVMLTGIPEVSNSLLAEMGLGLPLRHISVAKCTAIGDEGLRGLAAASPQLLTLRADQCTKITDDGVVALAESCKELQVLSLHGCTKVSDEAVAAVALHGSLHSLVVNSIPGIGLSTIKALATATRDRLEELDISWCRNVPSEALGMLADNCVALKKLHLWGCSQITEDFLYGHSNDALQILGGKLDTTGPDAAKAVLTAEQS